MKDEEIKEKNRFKFERKGLDFPFYNNNPHLSTTKWGILLVGLLITFTLIMGPWEFPLKRFTYFLIPFLSFGIATNWKFNTICKKFKKKDISLILIIIILSFIYSILISSLLTPLGVTSAVNPVRSQLHNLSFWIVFPFQIFGEELTKLIMLILTLFVSYKITNKRKLSIIIATLICAIIFGLLHLPAYQNIIVSILTVGIGDIIIIYGYLKTKNILIPFTAHLFYNLIPLIITLLI